MRPASLYAKTIVAVLAVLAELLNLAVTPEQLEAIAAGAIAVLGVAGIWRVPNELPDPILEQLAGEPAEGDRTTLGAVADPPKAGAR